MTVRLMCKIEKRYFVWSVLDVLVVSMIPLITIYFPKLILEKITTGMISDYDEVLNVIAVFALLFLALKLLSTYISKHVKNFAEIFAVKLKYKLAEASTKMELSIIESPSTQDNIRLANKASGITDMFSLIQRIVASTISIIGISAIISRLDFAFYIVIVTVLLIKTPFTLLQYSYNKKVRSLYTEIERTGDYLQGLAYLNPGAQKEIRVNNLYAWFMSKIGEYRGKMLRLQYRDFIRNSFFQIAMAFCLCVETLFVLFVLANKYTCNEISISDLTMYFSATITLTTLLTSLTPLFQKYNEQMLNLGDYEKIISALATDDVKATDAIIGKTRYINIVFENVSFMYPGTERFALKNINLTITNNEKIVIVGQNGSGKTTLIKLLCKFYKPTDGRILLNGIDIWSIPNDDYYQNIGAVFQDYKIFAFSVAENISITDSPNYESILSACDELGMKGTIEKFPLGLDTYISRVFSTDGIELSGGEGQKLAIVRAFYKNTPLLILDEPTASLDVKTECEIYEDFLKVSSSKTTVFISHRLAASTLADNIAVFSDGEIIEYGNHNALIKQNGIYADMFKKQSKSYLA